MKTYFCEIEGEKSKTSPQEKTKPQPTTPPPSRPFYLGEKYTAGRRKKKVSACPETEADNRRTGRGIIAINVSQMHLCGFYSGHESWTKNTRYITMRGLPFKVCITDGLTHK